MADDATVTITLSRDEAIVLDNCLTRMFGENDLHDWNNVRFSIERESEQWPFFSVRDALADQLVAVNTAPDYFQILDNAHASITARQWGE